MFIIQNNALILGIYLWSHSHTMQISFVPYTLQNYIGEMASSTIMLGFFCPVEENGGTLVKMWVISHVAVAISGSFLVSKEASGQLGRSLVCPQSRWDSSWSNCSKKNLPFLSLLAPELLSLIMVTSTVRMA